MVDERWMVNECLEERGPWLWAQSSSPMETEAGPLDMPTVGQEWLCCSQCPHLYECVMGAVGEVAGDSGEAVELRGDRPFKVLGYFRRRRAGCLGHLANSCFRPTPGKVF